MVIGHTCLFQTYIHYWSGKIIILLLWLLGLADLALNDAYVRQIYGLGD